MNHKQTERTTETPTKSPWKLRSEPAVTLRCDEFNAKHLPKDLRPLAQLVAHPETKESVWMNACVAAGNRSLANKPSFFAKTGSTLYAFVGAFFAMATLLLNFILSILATSHSAFIFGAIDANTFFQVLGETENAGLVMIITTGVAFWTSLLFRSRIARSISLVSCIFLATIACGLGLAQQDTTSFWLFGPAAGFTTWLVAWFGNVCRTALPQTFSSTKVAHAMVGALLLPAALCIALITWSAMDPTPSPTIKEQLSGGAANILFSMFLFNLGVQSIAVVRASRTTSKQAAMLLSACLQAPLFASLAFAAFVAAGCTLYPGSLSSEWVTFGLSKTAFSAATVFMTIGIVCGSSLIGTGINSFCDGKKKN